MKNVRFLDQIRNSGHDFSQITVGKENLRKFSPNGQAHAKILAINARNFCMLGATKIHKKLLHSGKNRYEQNFVNLTYSNLFSKMAASRESYRPAPASEVSGSNM